MKSQSLPINTIVILVLAVITLAAVGVFFLGGMQTANSQMSQVTGLSEAMIKELRMSPL